MSTSEQGAVGLADLPKFNEEEVPDGWTRNEGAAEVLGTTALFQHEDDRWVIIIRRYDPGRADGERVCQHYPEDDETLIAPLFETRLVSIHPDNPNFLHIQTDEMESADRLSLEGQEALVYPDPDGAKLLLDLEQRETKRQEIEDRDKDIYEVLEESVE